MKIIPLFLTLLAWLSYSLPSNNTPIFQRSVKIIVKKNLTHNEAQGIPPQSQSTVIQNSQIELNDYKTGSNSYRRGGRLRRKQRLKGPFNIAVKYELFIAYSFVVCIVLLIIFLMVKYKERKENDELQQITEEKQKKTNNSNSTHNMECGNQVLLTFYPNSKQNEQLNQPYQNSKESQTTQTPYFVEQ